MHRSRATTLQFLHCSIAIFFAFAGTTILAAAQSIEHRIDFSREIQPILANHCWSCHGPDEKSRQAELRLDIREQALAKSAFVPGDDSTSELVRRIESIDEDSRMPPSSSKKPLNEKQKELLRGWIQQGATYSKHWAFEAPVRPTPPMQAQGDGDDLSPVDQFVRDRLKREQIAFSPQADRGTLLRRVTLDLTGLPPTLDELHQFLSDSSDKAYEKVVDRLLASERYAERMAMSWLDLARYADTNGYNNDEDRTMWPWRDWIIKAFHQNMPYDQFVVEQLAGDMLPNPSKDQLIATAFLRNQGHNTEGGIIPEEYRIEYVADRVHTTATVFLGLSMQCARCHDHKYDPISQTEYYQFFAFFNNLDEKQASYNKFVAAEPFIRVPSSEQESQLKALDSEMITLQGRLKEREQQSPELLRKWIADHTTQEFEEKFVKVAEVAGIPSEKWTDEQRQQIYKHYRTQVDTEYPKLQSDEASKKKELEALELQIPAVMVMKEMAKPRETFVLKRGQYDHPSIRVSARVPSILSPIPRNKSVTGIPLEDAETDVAVGRLELARWLIDSRNPLTARVAVNRWWQSFFGTGLVKTVEDFGITGDSPSHPELLDYLATRLLDSRWNVKELLKSIVMSATYKQSSRLTPELLERDPENRLLARGPRNRLEAEIVRDNALAIAGLLQTRVGGPSVKPYQPAGLWEDVTVSRKGKYVADTGDGLYRRSMYTFWKRTCPPPSMMSFDAPNREVCTARRARTNTPLQSLVLLNDPTYVEAARLLAGHMIRDGGFATVDRINLGYRRCVSRDAKPDEQQVLQQILKQAEKRFSSDLKHATDLNSVGEAPVDSAIDPMELACWTIVASTLMNLDETISKR